MIEILVSFALMGVSAVLIRAWCRLLRKPTYMMEMTEFSRSALIVEKSYKLFVTGVLGAIALVSAVTIFIEAFLVLP